MAINTFIRNIFKPEIKASPDQAVVGNPEREGILKAFVSNSFLYKPPYGFPRMVDIPTLRELAKSPYVYMVVKTISDEVCSVDWDIVPKESDEPRGAKEPYDDTKKETYNTTGPSPQTIAAIKEVKKFFYHPNENNESFEHLMRATIRDILEIDSGVWVKVFDRGGNFKQMFARDGGTFLKNPDIYGYIGNKPDFVALPEFASDRDRANYFTRVLKADAAYFQYGWVAMMPIPFGKREIVYMMANPRSDSIYGRSPLEILQQIIYVLIYGSQFNMDFYTNNNMPDGVIQLLGANQQQIQAFRERFEKQFKKKDDYGAWRKIFHKYPIVNQETKFTPFQLKPAEMEIIQQQEWFSKLVWASFGITPSELGFTENSNKAVDFNQSAVFKRKAVKPMLRLLEQYINSEVMPEFGHDDLEFRFIEYDIVEDLEKHKLYEIQLKNGIKSVNEVREDMGLAPREGGDEYAGSNSGSEFGEDDELSEQKKPFEKTSEEKSMNAVPPMALDENEKPKKKIKKTLTTYLREREDIILTELQKIYTSDKLAEIKGFQGLWDRLIKNLETLFPSNQFKGLVDEFTKESFLKGMEQSELEFSQNFFPNQEAIDFLEDYNFDLIQNMTEEMGNQLKSTLQRGYLNDVPFEELKKEVKSIFDKNETRADTIVRTEQNRAENMGAIEGAKQSLIVKGKSLVGYRDDKTSPICRRMLNKYGDKTIGLDDNFVDGETGQSFKSPPFHPNCRTRLITPRKKQ